MSDDKKRAPPAGEPLAKRSKNVREHLKKVTPSQAHQRIMGYLQRRGISAEETSRGARKGFGITDDGKPWVRGDAPPTRTFPPAHEAGHLLMTPVGQTTADYQKDLNRDIDPSVPVPNWGHREEYAADAIEHGIARRAGAPVETLMSDRLKHGAGPERSFHAREVAPHMEAGRRELQAFDEGRKSPTGLGGAMVRSKSIDAKINQRAAQAVKKDEQSAEGEPLIKRSKNVREQTRNLTVAQIRARLTRYAGNVGFKIGEQGTEGSINGGTITPARTQPIAHELGHALMTPTGSTAGKYTRQLASMGERPKIDSTGQIDEERAEADRDEDVASVMEPGIARRAGVAPKLVATGFSPDPYKNPAYNSQDEYDDRDGKEVHAELLEDAQHYLNRVDTGQVKFKGGKAMPGTSVDAKINARAMSKGSSVEAGEPLIKRSKNVRQQTRNLSLSQIHERLGRYANKVGFKVGPASKRASISGDTITPGRNQPLSHELGHALMTPYGETAQGYTAKLAEQAKQPEYDESGEWNDKPHEAFRDEDVANVMEAGIARRAGIAPKEIATQFNPNPHSNPQYRSYNKDFGEQNARKMHAGLLDEAQYFHDRVDSGRVKFKDGGAVLNAGSIHARINHRAAMQKDERGSVGEPLAKRSKNVREQTRNISASQQHGRIMQYLRSRGFDPKAVDTQAGASPSFGNVGPKGVELHYDDYNSFPASHEAGHALTTPVGSNVKDKQAEVGGFIENDKDRARVADERFANAMQRGVERRAGVAPSEPEYAQKHKKKDPAGYKLTQEAAQHKLQALDEGRIKLNPATGDMERNRNLSVDAKINARGRGLMKSDDKSKGLAPPQWLGRPILHADHVTDLETRAAVNEFHHQMPRSQAEQHAHDGYVREQRERAAAHHMAGMKAAQATGNHEDARKHWALYDLHVKALGKESIGAIPPEIEKRMMEDGQKPLYRFKAHKGDLYALHAPSEDAAPPQGQPIQKAEAKSCKWKLGERRCKRLVSDGYCHDHKDHWANKIKQKEAETQPTEGLEKGDVIGPERFAAKQQAKATDAHHKELDRLYRLVTEEPAPPLPPKKPNESGKPCLRIHDEGNWTLCGDMTEKVPSEYMGTGKPTLRHQQDSLFCPNCVSEARNLAAPDVTKAEGPPAGTDHLKPPAVKPVSMQEVLKPPSVKPVTMDEVRPKPAAGGAAPAPQLHSTVDGFMAGLKAMPKGGAERGRFITQHMNHGPFLSALKAHPQGATMHSQLTQFMNGAANAGFRPGAARAVAKSEELLTALTKLTTLLKSE